MGTGTDRREPFPIAKLLHAPEGIGLHAVSFYRIFVLSCFCFCKAKDAIDENSPSEKAVNGPATASGDEPSKLQHSPDEKKVTVQEDGNNQEEAVLNGVS